MLVLSLVSEDALWSRNEQFNARPLFVRTSAKSSPSYPEVFHWFCG